MILFYTDEDKYSIRFFFDSDNKDYKINEKFNEWTYYKDWIMDRIPMNMKVENTSTGSIEVIQGFDHELTIEELTEVKNEMNKKIIEYLNFEKEIFLNKQEKKLKAANDYINKGDRYGKIIK